MRNWHSPLFPAPIGGADSGPSATQRGDRAWHRVLAAGVLIAVAFHLVLFLLWRSSIVIPQSPFGAAGPRMGDVRAAAGGDGGLEAVELRVAEERVEAAEPVEEVVVPVPVPQVTLEAVEPEPVREPAPAPAASLPGTTREPGAGGERGEAEGPGTATGTGQGGGGLGDEGANEGLVPPTPRGMFLPPTDRPSSVRGRDVTVWVFVDARGRVVADSTRLDPPTPDRKYNQRLRRSAAEWVFQPAERRGRPVPSWYPYEVTL